MRFNRRKYDFEVYPICRPGDLARIEPNVSGNAPAKKPKKTPVGDEKVQQEAEGVVYKVDRL